MKKYFIIGVVVVVLVAGFLILRPDPPFGADELVINVSPALNWAKPTTDKDWAEDTKKSNLNLKLDYQLDEIEVSLTAKLPKLQKDLLKYTECPECIRYELRERFTQMFKDNKIKLNGKLEGMTLDQWIEKEFAEELANKQLDTDMVAQFLERTIKEKELRASEKVDRTVDILSATPSTEKEKEAIQELKTLKGI